MLPYSLKPYYNVLLSLYYYIQPIAQNFYNFTRFISPIDVTYICCN